MENVEVGLYEGNDRGEEDVGVVNFLVRAILTPLEDPKLCSIDLVAIPVRKSEFKTMNGSDVAKVSGSFPSIYIRDGSNSPIRIVPSLVQGMPMFGLPAWPVIIQNEEDKVPPKSEDIVDATRRLWQSAIMVPAVSLEEWARLTSSTPVVAPMMAAYCRWPLLPRTQDPEQDPLGKINFI